MDHEGAPQIGEGYIPGLIGRAVEMMAVRILRDYPMGMAFETRVAREMAEFMPRSDNPQNAIWHASSGGRVMGTITIDGDHLGDGRAHLRWFVVDETLQGGGLGGALLQRALSHCDAQGFREVHLWTVRGLDAARRLYERAGFTLAEEYDGAQWGARVSEQKFVRVAPMMASGR
jgi:GNAT superfamily N-acetyltransferase